MTFTAAFTDQFDQAGVFLRASATQWVKAGVEHVDGAPCVGWSRRGPLDWSAFPVRPGRAAGSRCAPADPGMR